MPKFSNNSSGLDLAGPTLAMTALGETVRQMNEAAAILVEPIRQAQEMMDSLARPMKQMQEIVESANSSLRIMQETINVSLGPTVKMMHTFSEMAKRHKKMMESLTVFGFNGITRQASLGIFPEWLQDPQIIDGEITEEEKSPQRSLIQQVVTVPQPQALVPVTPKAIRNQTRARMGLKQISGGNFSYKRTTLKGLSLRNREGQLLKLLLEDQYLFISDETMCNNFYTQDIIEESQIVKLLKNKFKQNGLKAVIKRQGNGYILISIEYLQ